MNDEAKTLEEQLGEDDWALVIGKDGNLKGVFIPAGANEELVPYSIIHIMSKYFGVDFEEEIDDALDVPPTETLH